LYKLLPVCAHPGHPLPPILEHPVPGKVREAAVILHMLDVRISLHVKWRVFDVTCPIEVHGNEAPDGRAGRGARWIPAPLDPRVEVDSRSTRPNEVDVAVVVEVQTAGHGDAQQAGEPAARGDVYPISVTTTEVVQRLAVSEEQVEVAVAVEIAGVGPADRGAGARCSSTPRACSGTVLPR